MKSTDNEIWVFLSHSNKDYEKVRQVRNMLEEENLRPLMFFLHCLNDEDEIDELIKREIDCRKRFILCDSENARNSNWVQKEVNYIKSKQRIYQKIDIDSPIEKIKKELVEFAKNTRVYISSAHQDQVLYDQLKNMLVSDWDYRIFNPRIDLKRGMEFDKEIRSAINIALDKGLIFFLVTNNFLQSEWCVKELNYSINSGKFEQIIIVLQESITLPEWADSKSLKIVKATIKEDKLDIGYNSEFYWNVMRPQIKKGVEERDPNAMYWLSSHYYWDDDRFGGIHMDGMRLYAAKLAKNAADMGHANAQNLYKSIIGDYPELRQHTCIINPDYKIYQNCDCININGMEYMLDDISKFLISYVNDTHSFWISDLVTAFLSNHDVSMTDATEDIQNHLEQMLESKVLIETNV